MTSDVSADRTPVLTDAETLQQGLLHGGAGVWRWRIDSTELRWSPNLEAVHDMPAGSFDGTLTSFVGDVHAEDVGAVWAAIETSIRTDAPYRTVYRTARATNGATRWIETSGGVVRDRDGVRYLTGICQDVTTRVRDRQQLARRLKQQQAIAAFGSFALNELSLQAVLDRAVRIAADVLDAPLTKILQFADAADHLVMRAGIGWAEGLVGHGIVGIERESQAGYTLIADGPVLVADLLTEERFDGPTLLHDHQVRSGVSVVIPGQQNRPFGVFGIHTRDMREFDDTDAQFLQSMANIVAGAARHGAAMDQRTLLVREMAHRAGNMLQLVSSIASQTFRPEVDPQLARVSFSERLNALARSNHVVSRGGWTATPFVELVADTLRPFGARVVTEGRDVLLPPELCFDLGLVLHELATNSAKYGSLGKGDGAIRISWRFRPGAEPLPVFEIDWADTVPQSEVAPRGTGFGAKLLDALVARKWNGTVTRIEAAHFALRLEIPVPAETA